MKASEVIQKVRLIVSDADSVAYTLDEMDGWLQEALESLVLMRPEANTVTETMPLEKGSTQMVPDGVIRLQSVLCNVTPDGSGGYEEGRSVRMTERRIFDQFDPDWRKQTQKQEVREYFVDQETPRELHVFPPNDGTGELRVRVSRVPELGDLNSDPDLPVEDTYAPALVDWVCYRIFIRTDERTPDHQRGIAHYQRFRQMLGADNTVSQTYADGAEGGGSRQRQ